MKAPFASRIKDPEMAWEANSDPQKVDDMYIRIFGPGGQNMLSEEVKWLALTHKSFDQGRRGFNDRLAYFGRLCPPDYDFGRNQLLMHILQGNDYYCYNVK